MPKMFVNSAIALSRDGNRIMPPVGKVFNFTKDEIDEITRLAPRALRPPVNESAEAEASVDDATDKTPRNPNDPTANTVPKPDTKTGGGKTATTTAGGGKTATTPDTKGL